MRIQYIKASLTAEWSDVPEVELGAEFYHLEFSAEKDGDVGFYFTGGREAPAIPSSGIDTRGRWIAKFARPYVTISGSPALSGSTDLPDGTIIINPDGFGSEMTVGADEEGNGATIVHKVVYLYHVGEIPTVPSLDQ